MKTIRDIKPDLNGNDLKVNHPELLRRNSVIRLNHEELLKTIVASLKEIDQKMDFLSDRIYDLERRISPEEKNNRSCNICHWLSS